MATLSIPRLDVLGYSSSLTRDIGPGPSSRTVGIQGKIGPHKMYFKILIVNFAYYFFFFFESVIERFALVSVLVFDKFFICLV